MKIIIVGQFFSHSLELSYSRELVKLGHEAIHFGPVNEIDEYIKFGFVGKKISLIFPVEIWIRKMNRKLIVLCKEEKPEAIFIFQNAKILPSTLVCIKTMFPDIRLVWIWPDTPFNLESHVIQAAPMLNIFATYSSSSKTPLMRLGFGDVEWVPLAGDRNLHYMNESSGDFKVDIGFVGGWRPERERIMDVLCLAFPELKIEIHGPLWKEKTTSKLVKQRVVSKGLFSSDLANFLNYTRININIIDDTNYPAANMRFFEIPMAFGLQLSSECPEQRFIFEEYRDILYFSSEDEVVEKVNWILNNSLDSQKIRKSGHEKVLNGHTYEDRAQQLLKKLE